jgi:predicted phage terminase large subunit-like protein
MGMVASDAGPSTPAPLDLDRLGKLSPRGRYCAGHRSFANRDVTARSIQRRANPGDVEQLLLNTATQDGKRVTIGFGQDPGQAGKSQAQHLVRALSGFTVRPATESGNKLTRFGPFSKQCGAGNVKIRRGSWNEELFSVLEGFPDLAHDDEVDARSGALEMLNPQIVGWGILELARQELEAAKQRSQPRPTQTVPQIERNRRRTGVMSHSIANPS